MRHALVGLSLVITQALAAQVALVVTDARTDAPLPDVTVIFQPLDGTTGSGTTTDQQGRATVPLNTSGTVVRLSAVGRVTIQDTLRDTRTRAYRLEASTVDLGEVVITGQYAPGSVEKAVQPVRVIDAERIQRMAARDLAGALRNELNIRLSQDNVLGSSISMQGLGGENVKVLVDGVPVIGRQDGNLDLGQLDLSGIERVEVVDGPLSVDYGTNALAGTINLITRKGDKDGRGAVRASAYAEHIGTLDLNVNATRHGPRHDLALTLGRDVFLGWDPDQGGLPDLAPQPADSTRHQQWKPREQYTGRFFYRWNGKYWNIGYKLEGMHDRIVDRGAPRVPYYETAFDADYVTTRLDNALFAEGHLREDKHINVLLAHDRYMRRRITWYRDLTTLDATLVDAAEAQDTNRFTLTELRGTLASSPDSTWLRYSVGIDLVYETGSGDRIGNGAEDIGDNAIFGSAEMDVAHGLTLRPGVRFAYNTRYGAPVTPALNLRWRIDDRLTLRAGYARGFRAPSLKELYLQFVDVNHDIVGNPDLRAERSHHADLELAFRKVNEERAWGLGLGMFYNAISDRITLAQLSGTRYSYVNIGRYHTLGGNVGGKWGHAGWHVSAGAAITGVRDELADTTGRPYLFSPEVRASIEKDWKHAWRASVYWKYQGSQNNYVLTDAGVAHGTIADYQMADASASKGLWKERLWLTLGCKNILDVRDLNASMGEGGVHSGGGGSVPLATGRTWFVRLALELKKQDR
ncbi:MAG: TonB-dependent receptor [Flavobacteriales bacterium]|nr:TonB-dependent receptor [Flavobacteriales bacterium]MCB9166661.1 TonB-dependent receptor [Flavobacteriales bacterium]